MKYGMNLVFVVAGLVALWGCEGKSPIGPGAGGDGGMVEGRGGSGAGGSGGLASGGVGGDLVGTGGVGGLGPGGSGGDDDPAARFGLPGVWEKVEFETPLLNFQIYEGVPSAFDFPRPVWEPCGEGCESAVLPYGSYTHEATLSTVPSSSGGTTAVIGIRHIYEEGPSFLWRVVGLTDGETIGAYFAVPTAPGTADHFMANRHESALSTLHSVNEGSDRIYGTLDPGEGWMFREPFDESTYRSRSCKHFDLDSSPPAYLFACPRGLEIMKEPGNSTITTIPDSGVPDSVFAVDGAGSHGLAVWSQLHLDYDADEASSKIRTWAPDGEVRTLAEVPGFVCGLGIGGETVVGLTGAMSAWGTGCNGALTEPRFFYLPREGGALVEGPLLSGDSLKVAAASVAGDYMAVRTMLPPGGDQQNRNRILLVRLSDWTIRGFAAPPDRFLNLTTVAVDDTHLYFNVDARGDVGQVLDRIYRHRLDHFDDFGELIVPAPPAAPY